MLHVHRSARADHLVDALGDVLRVPLDEPMATEVVAVPTRGVERWLSQRLSGRLGVAEGRADGVCANVDFPFPGVLIGSAAAAACGFDPVSDPWPPERSVWPLLELVDTYLGDPFLTALRQHLQSAPAVDGHHRRFATVRRIADLYDRYALNRPDMVERWADGDTVGATHDERWQADLWRCLRQRIDVPSPAERSQAAAAALAKDPSLVPLPSRVSLFGLTRLAPSHLRILQAIASGRDVHLFLLHPSPALWEAVAAAFPDPPARLRRADDPTTERAVNPLLRSWGRDTREMQLVLASHGVSSRVHGPVGATPTTLLGRIQHDIRDDVDPGRPDREPPPLDADDTSLRIHSCHGRARQVEVMRDAVLHALASDPTLEPRDVIIMCPDIEAFAPLVLAAFGAGGDPDDESAAADLPRVRVRLADRSIRQTNPLLSVSARLLQLAGSRVTASAVLDLAACEPVRRRFRLDDEDLARIERWVTDAGVRWGLSAEQRRPWELQDMAANTWAAGMERMLLGAAMSEDDLRLVGGVLPLDEVAGSSVDLLGRFAELVDRLGSALGGLSGLRPMADWAATLSEATERLALAAPNESWQHDQLHEVFDHVAGEAATARRRARRRRGRRRAR